jgi:hypothetical protein
MAQISREKEKIFGGMPGGLAGIAASEEAAIAEAERNFRRGQDDDLE